jgi:hypothetical protein
MDPRIAITHVGGAETTPRRVTSLAFSAIWFRNRSKAGASWTGGVLVEASHSIRTKIFLGLGHDQFTLKVGVGMAGDAVVFPAEIMVTGKATISSLQLEIASRLNVESA